MNETPKRLADDLRDWETNLANCMFSLINLEQRLRHIIELDSITDHGVRIEAYLTVLEKLIDKMNQTHQHIQGQYQQIHSDGKLMSDHQISETMKKRHLALQDEVDEIETEYLVMSKNAIEFLKEIHQA